MLTRSTLGASLFQVFVTDSWRHYFTPGSAVFGNSYPVIRRITRHTLISPRISLLKLGSNPHIREMTQ